MENCQAVVNEFGQYSYKEDGDEPLEKHDHAMDALRYALFTDTQRGGQSLGIAGANRG